jgi:hypothetical protein
MQTLYAGLTRCHAKPVGFFVPATMQTSRAAESLDGILVSAAAEEKPELPL